MPTAPRAKRPLAEVDANVQPSEPEQKVAKGKTGQKHRRGNQTYAAMSRDELATLAKSRNLIHGGSKLDIIEHLEEADKPKSNFAHVARMEKLADEAKRHTDFARKQLTKELQRPVAAGDPRVRDRVWAMNVNARALSGNHSWTETPRYLLVEVAKLRGLKTTGTRDELKKIIMDDDEQKRNDDPEFTRKIIDDTIKKSCAFKRAVEIMASEILSNPYNHLPRSNGLSRDEALDNYNTQRAARDAALDNITNMAEEFALQMANNKEKLSQAVVGARCLDKVIPGHVSKGNAGSYARLHIAELQEMLRLRGEDTKGQKPELVQLLQRSDRRKYGGAKSEK